MLMRKSKLPYVILVFLIVMLFFVFYMETKTTTEMDYYNYADTLDLAEVIDSGDLTIEMLESRNGKLIIERAIGVVTDAETGAGHMIDNANEYISYSCVKGIKSGNVMCTYFVYNPDNNYYDDIVSRFDYVIDISETE